MPLTWPETGLGFSQFGSGQPARTLVYREAWCMWVGALIEIWQLLKRPKTGNVCLHAGSDPRGLEVPVFAWHIHALHLSTSVSF